jgi:hypothetical protein
MNTALRCLAVLLLGAPTFSQSNADPAIDLELADIGNLRALGREGTFPNGINGVSMSTTACNKGTKQILWQAAMDPDHPFITFILARESGGRFEQISDRSYVKHGFFALSSSFCDNCQPTDGTRLGLGCSDTYDVTTNGDSYYLGPPDEIDPWMGQWTRNCSQFDRGEPPRAPPQDCDGARSLTRTQVTALGNVAHRMRVKDADFDVAGASYWFQGMYIIETEGEAARGNNIASRSFTPSWNGTRWVMSAGTSQAFGSVLSRWTGASLASATNGGDDGRLYVAVKVTGPEDGFYHYEFAVHNRDNNRGVGALRIPVCQGARVKNLGAGDLDDDAGNDWSGSVAAGEITFAGAANPLRWNSIFNFWFDSDAAPLSANLALDQAAAGPGLASVAVASSAPLGLWNVHLGAGCAKDTPPTLFAAGASPHPTLGNSAFALHSTGNDPNQPSTLRFSLTTGSFVLRGCTFHLGNSLADSAPVLTVLTDASGLAVFPAPIPADISFEGLQVSLQTLARDPGNGTFLPNYELSDGLLVRVGDAQPNCP